MLRNILLRLYFCVIPLSMAFCTNRNHNEITVLKVSSNAPVVGQNGIAINMEDIFYVYSWKNLMLYQFRTSFESFYDGDLVKQEFRNDYLLFKRQDLYGTYYKNGEIKKGRTVAVDSLLNRRALKNFSWHLFDNSKSIISSQKSMQKIFERYVIPTDTNPKDTLEFYYSKEMMQESFSFSTRLDSIKK